MPILYSVSRFRPYCPCVGRFNSSPSYKTQKKKKVCGQVFRESLYVTTILHNNNEIVLSVLIMFQPPKPPFSRKLRFYLRSS
jgi:hypothetical protein